MTGPRNNLEEMLAKIGSSRSTVSAVSRPDSAVSSPKEKPTFTLARNTIGHLKPSGGRAAPGDAAYHMPENLPPPRASTSVLQTASRPATLGSAILTPQSLNGSPIIRGSIPAVVPPQAHRVDGGLDSMPLERLTTLLVTNLLKKTELLEKLRTGGNGYGDDLDPFIVEAQIKLYTTRIEELQAAITLRSSGQASSTSTHTIVSDPVSSGRSNHSVPINHQHTHANSRPLVPHLPRHAAEEPIFTAPGDYDATSSRGDRPHDDDSGEEDVPLAKAHKSLDGQRTRKTPSEARRLAIAASGMNKEIIPPSTPPRPRSHATQTRQAALAEFQDVPVEEFFSSPASVRDAHPPPRVSQSSASKLPGTQSKLNLPPTSQAMAGPGPSTVANMSRTPGPVQAKTPGSKASKIEVVHEWTKEVEQKLRQVFRLPRFRMHQKEAVDATMAAKDGELDEPQSMGLRADYTVFVLMPTGGGKSLTYQLPAICSTGKTSGVTFVISPLISLINDQTRHLLRLDIPAIAYTGDMSAGDKAAAHESLMMPNPWTKVVYVTPEMMSMGGRIKGIMQDLVRRKRLARFVIDEAHCVSQWGHDFRSDYLKLGQLRKEYPSVPIMALTATAQNKVEADIIRTLGITGCIVLRQSFNRPNLQYEVRPKTKAVIDDIVGVIRNQRVDGEDVSGIIYCGSREKCELLAKELREKYGLRAKHYHAGMSKGDRRGVQEGWQEHDFEIIVATVAFGMGIDKPDVRFVIHHSVPRSLEGYYQETGRGGRDGKQALCILFYSYQDCKTVLNMIDREKDLSREQKTRQQDAMNEVVRFCMNKTDCRRSQVLSFFSETFDPVDCNAGCDVCLGRDKNVYATEDVSDAAITVLKMINSFNVDSRVTVISAADIWRGASKASTRDYTSSKYFGAGKDWERGEAERLVQLLLIEKALGEFNVTNYMGWSNSYLKLGPAYNDFIKGNRKLEMNFRAKSPLKGLALRRTKSTGSLAAPAAKNKKGQMNLDTFAQPSQRLVSNPISRKRSLQQIAAEEEAFDKSTWGDEDYDQAEQVPPAGKGKVQTRKKKGKEAETSKAYERAFLADDQDDPIVLSGDETEGDDDDVPLAKKRKSLPTAAGGQNGKERGAEGGNGVLTSRKDLVGAGKLVISKSKADPIKNRKDSMTPVEACLISLKQMVKKVRGENKHAPQLDDYVLELLASMMPMNNTSLGQIEGITTAHLKHYGPRILAICIKHVEMQEKWNGIERGTAHSRLPAGPPTVHPRSNSKSGIASAASTAARHTKAGPSKPVASLQSFALKPNVPAKTVPLSATLQARPTSAAGPTSNAAGGEKRFSLATKTNAVKPSF